MVNQIKIERDVLRSALRVANRVLSAKSPNIAFQCVRLYTHHPEGLRVDAVSELESTRLAVPILSSSGGFDFGVRAVDLAARVELATGEITLTHDDGKLVVASGTSRWRLDIVPQPPLFPRDYPKPEGEIDGAKLRAALRAVCVAANADPSRHDAHGVVFDHVRIGALDGHRLHARTITTGIEAFASLSFAKVLATLGAEKVAIAVNDRYFAAIDGDVLLVSSRPHAKGAQLGAMIEFVENGHANGKSVTCTVSPGALSNAARLASVASRTVMLETNQEGTAIVVTGVDSGDTAMAECTGRVHRIEVDAGNLADALDAHDSETVTVSSLPMGKDQLPITFTGTGLDFSLAMPIAPKRGDK